MDRLAEFARREDLALVVLWGSQASGTARAESDLDLALLPKNDASREAVERRLVQFLGRGDLDLLWLPHASPLVRSRVAATGRVLYEDRPCRFQHFLQDAILQKEDCRFWEELDNRYIRRCLERKWEMDRPFVTRKLAQLAEYLEQLEQVMLADEAEFSRDFRIHRVAERQIELLVECAGKLNTELSQSLAKIPASGYYSSFFSLASTGWLDRDVAARLATLAGLRNRLVHQYDDLRLPLLYTACRESLPDWRLYLRSLSERLQA